MTVATIEKTERYIILFGGIVALVLGILLFTQTTASLAVVMLLVGLTWFIQGIFNIAAIFIEKAQWGWNLFGGVIGIAAGLLVLQNPVASTAVVPAILAIILGLFGLLIGIAALLVAFQGGGWGAGVFGAVSIIIGLLLMFNSMVSGQMLVWIVAAMLMVQGAVGVFLGFKSQ